MKKLFIVLLIVLFAIPVHAGTCTLTFEWTANTEPDLAGYRLFTHAEGEYDYTAPIWEGTETTCQYEVNDYETHYFVVRAYDTEGLESVDSNEVNFIGPEDPPWVNTRPNAPTLEIIDAVCIP